MKTFSLSARSAVWERENQRPWRTGEPGETSLDAAVRETREELGIEALSPELRVSFISSSLMDTAFTAVSSSPKISSASPSKRPRPSLLDSSHRHPHEQMWPDDIWWLPKIIAGGKVRGFFHFEEEKLLSLK